MNHLLFASSSSMLTDKITVGHLVAAVGLVATLIGVIYGRQYITGLKMGVASVVTGLLALASWLGVSEYQKMQFDARMRDYVVAAYKTDDKEKAKKYIDKSLDYLHETGADTGHSAVFAGGQTDDLNEFASDLKKVRADMEEDKDNTQETASLSVSDGDPNNKEKSKKKTTYKERLVELGFINLGVGNNPEFKHPAGMKLAPYNFHYALWVFSGLLLTVVGGGVTTTRIIQNKLDKTRTVCQTCNGEGYRRNNPTT